MAVLLSAQALTVPVTQAVTLNISSNETPVFVGPGWTLAHAPKYLLFCFLNGIYQTPGIDFSILANVITSAYWLPDDTPICNYGY